MCGIAEMEKGHSTGPYLSPSQMKAQNDVSLTGLVKVTETVSERVQQPKESAAHSHFTLPRSALLILCESFKSSNSVAILKTDKERRGSRIKLTVADCMSSHRPLNVETCFYFGSADKASLTSFHALFQLSLTVNHDRHIQF